MFLYGDNPKLRNDITNGVCMCSICHKEFHKNYGYGKNNIYQFYDYIDKFCIFDINNNNNE